MVQVPADVTEEAGEEVVVKMSAGRMAFTDKALSTVEVRRKEVEAKQVEDRRKPMVRQDGGPPPALPWKSHLEGGDVERAADFSL